MLDTILAVSPGTKHVGIALFRKSKLLDWTVEYFPGKWSDRKLSAIISNIGEWIAQRNVEGIAIKIPDELPRSAAYIQLVASLNGIAERNGLHTKYYTLSELKNELCRDQSINRFQMMDFITSKFHALLPELEKERSNKSKYYFKVFEAIAAGYLLNKTIQ